MIYLSSPFTHPNRLVETQRFLDTLRAVHLFIKEGEMVFSPILHSYPIYRDCGIPGNLEFWKKWNEDMIGRCDKVVVLKLRGWQKSKGVAHEITYAKLLGTSVNYLEPIPYAV